MTTAFYISGLEGGFEHGYGIIAKCKKCKYKGEYHLGAAIMAEQRLYQCSVCNHLEQEYDLSLCLNKNGTPPEHD